MTMFYWQEQANDNNDLLANVDSLRYTSLRYTLRYLYITFYFINNTISNNSKKMYQFAIETQIT